MFNSMLMRVFTLSIPVALLMTGCNHEDPDPAGNSNQINFEAPIVNQTNYYLRYEGQCGQLMPTGDTLVVWIALFNGYELQLAERFTPGSPSYSPYPFIYGTALTGGNLIIAENIRPLTYLFNAYGSDTLKLTEPAGVDLVQNHCIVYQDTEPFTGNVIGALENFVLDTIGYEQKRVTAIVPDSMDTEAFLIYDQRNIYAVVASETGGWHPTPDPVIFAYILADIDKE